MAPAVRTSWQLLSILNTNTDVQQRTVGAIIFQVMKMENRRVHNPVGVELADARSYQRPHLPPTPLPVLGSQPRIPFAAVVISGWTVNRTIQDKEGKRFVLRVADWFPTPTPPVTEESHGDDTTSARLNATSSSPS